jgi:hypothetical protein
MGAGNPKLKSFDNDRFEPTTLFVDLAGDFDFDTFKNELEKESGEEYSDTHVWDLHGQDLELNYEDLIQSICSELGHKYHDKNYHRELSYAFREEGIVLTEGANCFVITETGSDFTHLPLAIIPSFRFETILDDIKYENSNKEEWYNQRGKNFDAAMEKLADKAWDKMMKVFFKEEKTIVKRLKEFYPNSLSQRNGAWCSSPLA